MTQIADRPARPDETLAVAVSDITQSLTMVQAINRALYDAMAADERVLVFGEDVAVEGGVFRVTGDWPIRSVQTGASTRHWRSPRSSE